jgi:CRP-like cAMP-binding protein
MTWIEIIGYAGSALMFSTFYMKTMMPLRITAIAANVVMITYTGLAGVYPVLVLQTALLPLNLLRLVQMRKLMAGVRRAARGDFRADALIPFMHRVEAEEGEVLFAIGDQSEAMYLLESGEVRLVEFDVTIKPGAVVGEIGLLSPFQTRTATARCSRASVLHRIDQDDVVRLYYQDPEFAFYLIKLVVRRLLHNVEAAEFDAMATLKPGQKPPAGISTTRR